MDRATMKAEIPESLMTDEIIHDSAGNGLSASALYYSGSHREDDTELKLEGLVTYSSVTNEEKMGDDFINQSSGMISDLVVIAPQEDNYHKYELIQTNGGPNAQDHEEEFNQDISIPAVEQEMDVVQEENTGDLFMENVVDIQMIKEEIQDSEESLKLEDGMNGPWVPNFNETVDTEGQSVVMKNEFSGEFQDDFVKSERFDGDLGQSIKQVSRRTGKPRNHPRTETTTSSDEGSEYEYVSSMNDSWIGEEQDVHSGQNHQIHLRQIHGMYCCDYCDRRFSQLSKYESHLLKPNNNKNNKCTKCDKTFMCESEVLQHSLKHIGKKPYPCTTCHETFEDQNGLKIHQRTHKDEKPYVCTICDKSFMHSSSLLFHQQTHTGEKPYVCTICDKSFGHQTHLKAHQRTHTREKPYACTMCDRTCRTQRALELHQRTHTGEKPYGCPHCGKKFVSSGNMNRHRLTHKK